MSVHSDGVGSSWNETLDIDQPHGLDYREWNDIRLGIRKRMAQEHAAPADNTVGGQHTPGGAGVLLLETTANMTTLGAAADLTSAHEFGIACNTATDPTGETLFYFGDDTVPVRLPVSWNNVLTEVTHIFGSEITIGPPVVFQNRVDCSANLVVDSSADFSDVYVEGDLTVDGALEIDGSSDFSAAGFAGDITVSGGKAFDGTGIMYQTNGGYQIADVSGGDRDTQALVFTKYFSGCTANDTSTGVAHSITDISDKLLSATGMIWGEGANGNIFSVADYLDETGGTKVFRFDVSTTNCLFRSVGADFKQKPYRIRLDYEV